MKTRKKFISLLFIISLIAAAFACALSGCSSGEGAADTTEGRTEKIESSTLNGNAGTHSCSVLIECSAILKNKDKLPKEKLGLVPEDGIILQKETLFTDGESAFDCVQKLCRENKIHLESSFTPAYNSRYIEGINNIYQLDCGPSSGWMYFINGESINVGLSEYKPKDGDSVELRYTCSGGEDIK